MRYLARNLPGRIEGTICWLAVASVSVLGVASCSDTATQGRVGPTTSIVETGTPIPAVSPTPESTGATESAEQRCMHFAPSDHQLFLKAETVTIKDVRSIVVATLPPTPTSLLLPEYTASEPALMCWSASADRTSVANFWVTADNQSRVFCTAKFLQTVTPQQIGDVPQCP